MSTFLLDPCNIIGCAIAVVAIIFGLCVLYFYWQVSVNKDGNQGSSNQHKKRMYNPNEARIEKYFKYCGVSAAISLIAMSTCYLSMFTMDCMNIDNVYQTELFLIIALLSSVWVKYSTLVPFFIRLIHSFEYSTIKVSKFTKIWHEVWIGISLIAFIIAICVVIFSPGLDGVKPASMILGVAGIMYVINSLELLYEFVNKLSQLITSFIAQFGIITDIELSKLNKTLSIELTGLNTPENKAERQEDMNDEVDGKELEKKDEEFENEGPTPANMRKLSIMIRDMSKYTILVAIATLTSFIFFLVLIIGTAIGTHLSKMIVRNLNMIDGFINVICLTLQFYFSTHYYRKYCIKLHKLCESRYTKSVNLKLQESVDDEEHCLQLKKLDRQGTIGIERVATHGIKRRRSANSNNANKDLNENKQQRIMDEPNLATANMNSYQDGI